MVGMYFDSKRALATGIAVCGSGLGTFIFAPLASTLCDHYGWRGANLIIGALMLNGIACSLVYKPLKAEKKKKVLHYDCWMNFVGLIHLVISRCFFGNLHCYSCWGSECACFERSSSPTHNWQHVLQSVSPKIFSDLQHYFCKDTMLEVKLAESPAISSASSKSTRVEEADDSAGAGDEELPDARPLYRADVLYGGSVTNLAEFNANPDMRTYVNSVTDIPRAVTKGGKCSPALDVLKKMFDFSLLLSPTFISICLAGVFGFMGRFMSCVQETLIWI